MRVTGERQLAIDQYKELRKFHYDSQTVLDFLIYTARLLRGKGIGAHNLALL